MAITCTWSVTDMTHMDSDGGVILVRWSMVAASDGEPSFTATAGGKENYTYDPSSPDFTPYANLTESEVLGWVYSSLAEGDETPEEAKLRVEAERTAKVQGQIDRANTEASGLPWAPANDDPVV